VDLQAFQDELEKIAAASGIPFTSATRKLLQKSLGRRFRKGAKPIAAAKFAKKPFKSKFGAVKPRKKGDVPDRDDMSGEDTSNAERQVASVVLGPTSQTSIIG
jgi:hypothetical protein